MSQFNSAKESLGGSLARNPVEDAIAQTSSTVTLSNYLGTRLVEAGVEKIFAIPGDFILSMLDEFVRDPRLQLIGCCNELNAGYAADGLARARNGLSVVCCTYMVGGLSLINAVAGAYSEDLSMLIISGGPNSHDEHERNLVHHTIGEADLYQCSKCFEPVTCACYSIRHMKDAMHMIDRAIQQCIRQKKPVYLEIACNLSILHMSAPTPSSYFLSTGRGNESSSWEQSDPISLESAALDILACLKSATKPVLLCGAKIRPFNAVTEFLALAEALGCGVAVMPDAKGTFPEHHRLYMGCYWAGISSPSVAEIVESSDLIISVGAIFNDTTTMGWSALIRDSKHIKIAKDSVSLGGNRRHGNVIMKQILQEIAKRCPKRDQTISNFLRFSEGVSTNYPVTPSTSQANLRKLESAALPGNDPEAYRLGEMIKSTLKVNEEKLRLSDFCCRLQSLITSKTSLIVETGDSMFIGQRIRLADGSRYYSQLHYGSIGWSVGATLGVALYEGQHRDVIALIGDGSFQMTAQELSTMIRYEVNCTIFLMNNQGYTIEVQIHDNVYNDIKNWNYAKLVEVFRGSETNSCIGRQVRNLSELDLAIEEISHVEGVKFVECCLSRDDCTSSLLKWGARAAEANMRA